MFIWFPMKTENSSASGSAGTLVFMILLIFRNSKLDQWETLQLYSSQIQTLKSVKYVNKSIHCVILWAESNCQVGGAHKCKPVKFGKYWRKIEQIQHFIQWAESKCQIGNARKCKTMKFDKYCWKIEQIQCFLRAETKWQSGGDRRMAVTSHFVSETECGQGQLLAETPTYPILILSSWRVTKKKPWSGLK